MPEGFRGEHGHAGRVKEDRWRSANADQVETEEAVVCIGKCRPANHETVDLEPLAADVVEQSLGQRPWIRRVFEHGVQEVHAESSDSLLLPRIRGIEQPTVDDDIAGICPKRMLKSHAEPGVTFVATGVRPCSRGVGECEEPRAFAPQGIEPLAEQGKLVVEHLLDPFP